MVDRDSDGEREELLATGILGILAPAVDQVDRKVGEVRSVVARERDYSFLA